MAAPVKTFRALTVAALIFALLVTVVALPATVAAQQPANSSRPQLVLQTGHTDYVNEVAFSPEARWLASVGKIEEFSDGWGIVRFSDPATGQELAPPACSSPEFAAGAAEPVDLWGRRRAERAQAVPAERARLETCFVAETEPQRRNTVFSSDGKRFVTWDMTDNLIRIRDAQRGSLVQSLPGPSESYVALALSPDGRLLATFSHTPPRLRDPDYARLVDQIRSRSGLKKIPDPPFDSVVNVWDLATGKESQTWILPQGSSFSAPLFTADSRRLAASHKDGSVHFWDVSTAKEVMVLRVAKPSLSKPQIAFSSDGRWLAVGDVEDTAVKIWDLTAGREVVSLPGHSGGIHSLVFSPNGQWLATVAGDAAQVKLWELP